MDKYKLTRQRQSFVFSKKGVPYDYDPPDIINLLTKGRKDIAYLEIGVDEGATFDNIENVQIKHGVDPFGGSQNITHRMTSQMFFVMNSRFFDNKYDIIFIDAIHLDEFVSYEIEESLKILKDDGFIVLHDTCPLFENAQKVLEHDFRNILDNVICQQEKDRMTWSENTAASNPIGYNGDCWRTVAKYMSQTDYTIFSIPNACVTIISPTKLEKFHPKQRCDSWEELKWSNYYENFREIMNPISMSYFEQHIQDYLQETNDEA